MRNTKKEEKEKRKEEKEEDDNAVSLLMSVPLSLRLLSLVFFPPRESTNLPIHRPMYRLKSADAADAPILLLPYRRQA